MLKRLLIIMGVVAVVLIFLFVLMNQGAPEQSALTSDDLGALRVAVHDKLPAMGYRQYMDNPLEGFEIDLTGQLAAKIYGDEKLVDRKPATLRTALALLNTKEVDCVVATQNKPEKAGDYLYSDSYYTDIVRVFYKDGGFASVSDMGGKKIGVINGSYAQTMLGTTKKDAKSKVVVLENHPDVELVLLESYPDGKDFLEQGKIDGFCGADVFTQDFSGYQSFEIGTCDYVAVLRKDDTKLLEQVNAALGSLRESGELNKLKDKWND